MDLSIATLVITRGYGFSGKIIHKWAIFHGYVSHNQRIPEGNSCENPITPSLPVQLSQVDHGGSVLGLLQSRPQRLECTVPLPNNVLWPRKAAEIAKKNLQETNSQWCNIGLFAYHGYLCLEWCNIQQMEWSFPCLYTRLQNCKKQHPSISSKISLSAMIDGVYICHYGDVWKSLADVPLQMGLQATQVRFPKGNHWRWKEMQSPSMFLGNQMTSD